MELWSPGVRRIAVLRASGLGDLVFALPALAALRAAYPDAEIVLLGRPWHHELLGSRPSPVDRIVALPPAILGPDREEHGRALARSGLLARLQAETWDIAIQLHGGGRQSNLLVASLGARISAGCRTPDALPLDRSVPYHYWQHEVLRNLEVVGLVGAPAVTIGPSLVVTEDDREAIERRSAQLRDPLPHDLVVLHPGAGDARRRWPPASFAQAGDALGARGLSIAIVGSENEASIGRAVASAMRSEVMDLTGRLDLPALVGLLDRSALIVGNDSGPLHLGGAVGLPSVGIYWCGNLINAGPLFRSRAHPLVSWTLACPDCGVDCIKDRCPHTASFVAEVPVEAVVGAALALLDGPEAALRVRDEVTG